MVGLTGNVYETNGLQGGYDRMTRVFGAFDGNPEMIKTFADEFGPLIQKGVTEVKVISSYKLFSIRIYYSPTCTALATGMA